MRIKKFDVPEVISETLGLKPINVNRLGEVVALVGRNGAGKSRILNMLENLYATSGLYRLILDDIDMLPSELSQYQYELTDIQYKYTQDIFELDRLINNRKLYDKSEKAKEEYQKHKKLIELSYSDDYSKSEIDRLNYFEDEEINSTFLKYIRRINYQEVGNLLLKGQESSDKMKEIDFEQLVQNIIDQPTYNEFKSIHRSALLYLTKLPHQLAHDFIDCLGNYDDFNKTISFTRFSSLKLYVQTFLNKELAWKREKVNHTTDIDGVTSKIKGVWYLDGNVFDYNKLSDGEKTLFAFCLLFFLLDQNPNIKISESIIIIDEPELHLHPESELAVINGIRKVIEEKGQLWIATHSVNILANLSYDEIFLVKNNTIIPPSKNTPGNSFIELMGIENQIEKLSHFVTNISNWAAINFMAQCFEDPDVITSAKPNDPEVISFKTSLEENSGGKVLLDFGAGKGRVLNELILDTVLKDKFEFNALEPNPENQKILQTLNISNTYTTHSELPKNTFDYILLCNVLHELPFNLWQSILNSIKDALTDNGYIIIIEDLNLPKGEMIGEIGYLILDLKSLQELFSMDTLPGQIINPEERYKERIQCAVINKSSIGHINKDSMLKSMKSLQKSALLNVKTLRQSKNLNKLELGRKSAFYSQLYLNAVLAEDFLNTKKKVLEN